MNDQYLATTGPGLRRRFRPTLNTLSYALMLTGIGRVAAVVTSVVDWVPKLVVVVLDKTGEPIREGIFAADSNRPAAEGCAGCGNDQSGGTGHAIVVGIFPRAARLHVTEKPIPTITNPASNRHQRLDLGLVRKTPSPRSGPFPHFDAPERAVYIRVGGL